MTVLPRLGKVAVVAVSVGLHAAAGVFWFSNEAGVEMAGGAEQVVQASIGSSFADLAAGALVPDRTHVQAADTEDVTDAVVQDAAEVAEETSAEPVKPVETPAEAVTRDAEAQVAAQPVVAAAVPVSAPVVAVAPRDSSVAPQMPVDALPSEDALALASPVAQPDRADLVTGADVGVVQQLSETAATAEASPTERDTPVVKPVTAETARAPDRDTPRRVESMMAEAVEVASPDRVAVAEPVATVDAVEVSPRPPARPKRPKPGPQVTKAPSPAPSPPVAQGNADRNATVGSSQGTQNAQAARGSTRSANASAQRGNAAVSNYPGKVMRKISRVRKPRVSAKAAAVVRFSVTDQGALGTLTIAQSSGSAKFDQAALNVIRKAAPFAAPPTGAMRRFTIKIQGRS